MYNNKKNAAAKKPEKKSQKHELLDDIDDLQEMSKKWLKHNNNNSEITEEMSSYQNYEETETEDEQFQNLNQKKSTNQSKLSNNSSFTQTQKVSSQNKQTINPYQSFKQAPTKSSNIKQQIQDEQNNQIQQQQYQTEKKSPNQLRQQQEESLSQSQVSQQSSLIYQQNQQYGQESSLNQSSVNQDLDESSISQQKYQQQQQSQIQTNKFQKKKEFSAQSKARNHMPQIIDEDTEHFKVKLDHLINVFKTDAISEFMGMKKSMLEDQKMQVKYDTEKYLNLYEEKAAELSNTKQTLAEQIQENQIITARYEKLSQMCGEAKNRFWLQKSVGNYFNALKNYKKQQQVKKQHKKMADYVYRKHLLKRTFNTWYEKYNSIKTEKINNQKEQIQLEEVQEITGKYNKELEQIRSRLKETEKLLEEANQDKVNLQDNLKKAFMRGVCALNFEAMSILGNKDQNSTNEELQNQTQNINNTVNDMGANFMTPQQQQQMAQLMNNNPSNIGLDDSQMLQQQQLQQLQLQQLQQQQLQQQQNIPLQSNIYNNNIKNDYENNEQQDWETENYQQQQNIDNQKTIVYYQEPKIESKDHKWRNAPVVGVKKENLNKENINSTVNYKSSLPDFVSQGKMVKTDNFDVGKSLKSQLPQQQMEDDEETSNGRVVRVSQQQQQQKQVSFTQQQRNFGKNNSAYKK